MIVTMLFTNFVIVLATSTTPATTSTTAESTASPSTTTKMPRTAGIRNTSRMKPFGFNPGLPASLTCPASNVRSKHVGAVTDCLSKLQLFIA